MKHSFAGILIGLLLLFLITFSSCHQRTAGQPPVAVSSDTIIHATPDTMEASEPPSYDSSLNLNFYLVPALTNTDTTIISDDAAVFVYPDSIQIEKMKKEIGDTDFYTVADDAGYYQSEATQYLQNQKIAIVNTDRKYLVFQSGSKPLYFDTHARVSSGWILLLYKKNDTPLIISSVDVQEQYAKYFKKK